MKYLKTVARLPGKNDREEKLLHLWMVVVSMHTIEYAAKELYENNSLATPEKHTVNHLHRFTVEWLKSGMNGMTSTTREFVDTMSTDSVGAIAELLAQIAILPDGQIDWYCEVMSLVSLAANNRSPENKTKKEIPVSKACDILASMVGIPETEIEQLSSDVQKLIFAAQNRARLNKNSK